MSTDRGLEATRAIREKISREIENDPRRLVEYYVKYQEKFAGRLRRSPGAGREPVEPAAEAGAPGTATPHP